MTNPAMGYRIKERTMYDVMDTMSADGFARECLGWWSKTERARGENAIAVDDWLACRIDKPTDGGTIVYAVKFSADGAIGTVARCNRVEGEKPFVYVVESRSMGGGLRWFVDNLAAKKDKAAQIVIDGQSNAQSLTDQLLDRGVASACIQRPSTGDVIAACSSFANAVKDGAVTHYGQPALDDSATKTVKRRIGTNGGWGFASTDEADATLIEACALAYRSAMKTKRKPGRKAVVF
jgi:hypothetical protein